MAGDEVCTEGGNCACWASTVVNQYTCRDDCVFADCCSLVGCKCIDSDGDGYCNYVDGADICNKNLGVHACDVGEGSCETMCVYGSGSGDCEPYSEDLWCDTSPGVCQSEAFDNCTTSGGSCVIQTNTNTKGCCGPGGVCDDEEIGCDGDCSGGEICAGGNSCIGGVCRDPNCPDEADCSCPSAHGCYEDCSDGMGCTDGNVCQGDICVNSSCPAEVDCLCSGLGNITGTVYSLGSGATTNVVGGICGLASGTATAEKPGGGSEVSVFFGGGGVMTQPIQGNGNFEIFDVPTGLGYMASLTIGDLATWICACPLGCDYGSIISSPMIGVDFFVTDQRDAWFQVQAGNIHADGSIASNIPNTCEADPLCDEYLITEDVNNVGGIVSYLTGLDLGDMDNTHVSEDSWQAVTDYQGLEMKYDYFHQLLEGDPNGIDNWDGSEPVSTGVFESDSGLRTTGGVWNIAGGQKSVLLVDGDVVIDQNISVAEGSFLAIISSGNIVVADDVDNIEGVYIADVTFNTEESDSNIQLIAEGIFVGWGGVVLGRDFGTVANNTNPVEKFIYRPDLVSRAYMYLTKPDYDWREVAP